jgi:hypothetical protein
MKDKFRRCMAIVLAATMTVSSVPSNVIYASEETEAVSEVSGTSEVETSETVEETSAAETEVKATETEVKATEAVAETEAKAKEEVTEESEEETKATETEAKEEAAEFPDSEVSTEEAVSETETVSEKTETSATEKTVETEAKVEKGTLLISVSSQGGKIRVKDSKNNILKEISYVEGAEPYSLSEKVGTKITIEVEASDGFDVGTYRLTTDSGTKDETVATEGTKSLKKEVSVSKGTQKVTVSFAEVVEETETEEVTETVEVNF